MFRWLKYRQHKENPAILRIPCLKKDLCYIRVPNLGCIFCASSRTVSRNRSSALLSIENCCLWSSEWKIETRMLEFVLLIWIMLLQSPEMSWYVMPMEENQKKLGVPIFRRFSVSLFCRVRACFFEVYVFLCTTRVRGLDFCKPVSFSAYPHAACGGGLNATLSFSWSILKEIGITGV